MERPVHKTERIPLPVTGDVHEMHRMELPPRELQVLDGEVMEIHEADALLRGRIDRVESVHPVHLAEDLRLHGRVEGQAFHHKPVRLLVIHEEIDAGSRVPEPETKVSEPHGSRQVLPVSGYGTVSLQEDEPVRSEFLVQSYFLPAAYEVGEDVTQGNLRMDPLAVRYALVRRLLLLPFRKDGLRQELGAMTDTQEDMVLAVHRGVPGVSPEPDAVLEAAREDLEDHREREGQHEDKDGKVGHEQAGSVEHDGGDDVIENHRMSDKHLQAGDAGREDQLDPVPVRHSVGGSGQDDHMDGRAQRKQEAEDKAHPPPAPFPEQGIQQTDEENCCDGEADKPHHHRGSRYGEIVHVHCARRFSPQI